MSSAANISALITIICGLMLTDLFASLHRLIRHRDRVRWHWLPLAVAWYVFLIILKNWWGLVFQVDDSIWSSGWTFLYYGHLLLLFYLLASAVLPDDVPDGDLDLKVFYTANRVHFWGLVSLMNGLLLLVSILRPIVTPDRFSVLQVVVNAVMLLITLSLARVRNFRYHTAIVLLMIGLVTMEVIASF